MTLESGTVLAHYRLVEKIGEGGMASVWRAVDERLDREVALKLLPKHVAHNPEWLARFKREAKILAALEHPGIVTIHSVEDDGDHRFLTMALVRGRVLSQIIDDGALGLDEFLTLAIPIADAVAAAHERGITHRDLKPDNIMVGDAGQVKVLDFGLATRTAPGDTSITEEGQIIGSTRYMSPEQALGQPSDARSDVFALGTVFYEMLSGCRPFDGDSAGAVLSAIIRETPVPVTQHNHAVPRKLARIIGRCQEKKPAQRYADARELHAELEALARGAPSEVAPAPRTARWPMAALLGVLILAIAYILSRGGAGGRRTIVVLPLRNLGAISDAYFAFGMTEEITTRLAAVRGLGVISRTSAGRYAEGKKSVREIGDELDVEFVLSGSVRWDAASLRVRVTSELSRVSDEMLVWSDSYDALLDDIFDVQSDIARKVVHQLDIKLVSRERDALERKPTGNMRAYQAYLRGLEARFFDPSLACTMFERAVREDPGFALAWAQLARTRAWLHHSYADTTSDANLRKARTALDEATRLAPELPAVHLAEGFYLLGQRDYDAALRIFESVAQTLPNDTDVAVAIGLIHWRTGKFEQVLAESERALRLDPRNGDILGTIGDTLRALRRFEDADAWLARAIGMFPGERAFYAKRAENLVAWTGDTSRAREVLAAAPQSERAYREWTRIEWIDRNYDAALGRLDAAALKQPRDKMIASVLRAATLRLAGREDEAKSAFESLRMRLSFVTGVAGVTGTNATARLLLALAYSGLGRHEDAIRTAEAAVAQDAQDRVFGPLMEEVLAGIHVRAGRPGPALELLERLFDTSYQEAITRPLLRRDPTWDPLRDDPRFLALIAPRD